MIYMLTTAPFPFGMASTARLKCYIKALQRNGISSEVDVFERTPKCRKDEFCKNVQITKDNISYWYAGGRLYGTGNFFLKKWNQWQDKKRMLMHLKENLKKGDFVLIYFSDVKFQHQVLTIAHTRGAFVIKELNEVPGKGNKSKASKKIKIRTENELLPQYDGVICISDALMKYSKQFVSSNCKLLKIPIVVDFDEYGMDDKQEESRIQYIFHAGSLLDRKDGILGMIKAYAKAVPQLSSETMFICTGTIEDSSECVQIKHLIRAYNLEKRIQFTGYLSNEELKDKLAHASLVIINKNKTEQNKYCFSTKLAEYLAAGKPVAISDFGEGAKWLENGKSAYIYPSEDINALTHIIIHALNQKDERLKIAQEGREVCKKSFDYRNYSSEFDFYLKNF